MRPIPNPLSTEDWSGFQASSSEKMELSSNNSFILRWNLRRYGFVWCQTWRFNSSFCEMSHKENEIYIRETADKRNGAKMDCIYSASKQVRGGFELIFKVNNRPKVREKYAINSVEQLLLEPTKRFVVETRLNTKPLAKWLQFHIYCRGITPSKPANIQKTEEGIAAFLSAPELEMVSRTLNRNPEN